MLSQIFDRLQSKPRGRKRGLGELFDQSCSLLLKVQAMTDRPDRDDRHACWLHERSASLDKAKGQFLLAVLILNLWPFWHNNTQLARRLRLLVGCCEYPSCGTHTYHT